MSPSRSRFACLPLVAEAQAGKTDPTISKQLKEFTTAFAAKDAARMAAFYTEDATLNPPNEPAVRGRVAIQAWMQRMFDQGTPSLSLTPVESAISGNVAYSYEAYTFTMKPAAQRRSRTRARRSSSSDGARHLQQRPAAPAAGADEEVALAGLSGL